MVTRLRSDSQLCTKSCHMHPVHNCHHIISCHPPVKQYIMTHYNTEFKYPFHHLLFVIYQSLKGKGHVVGCFVRCILYTDQCLAHGTSLEVSLPALFRSSLLPSLPRSTLAPLPPSLASSFPSLPRSAPASFCPFFASSLPPPSLPQPTIPPFLDPAHSLPHIFASSLLTLPSTLPLLTPSHPPSFLVPSLPLLSWLPSAVQLMYIVCVFGKLHWVLCRV